MEIRSSYQLYREKEHTKEQLRISKILNRCTEELASNRDVDAALAEADHRMYENKQEYYKSVAGHSDIKQKCV